MFILRNNETNKRVHICTTEKVANDIQEYIKNKYNVLMEKEEKDVKTIRYDVGGIFHLSPELIDIEICFIKINIQHLIYLDESIHYLECNPDSQHGFYRIPSWQYNICFSEEEYLSLKKYFDENRKMINSYNRKVSEVLTGGSKKKKG